MFVASIVKCLNVTVVLYDKCVMSVWGCLGTPVITGYRKLINTFGQIRLGYMATTSNVVISVLTVKTGKGGFFKVSVMNPMDTSATLTLAVSFHFVLACV